ncbi:MAG: ATP-binding protein [Candidatus Cloacimonetes bacterium]|nr:ATP-binding protein [Candidatus Cloacimonadota bacterium]MDY0230123.1 ATP-binding protein [Candidatus Cloacimonadaceae bacterium]
MQIEGIKPLDILQKLIRLKTFEKELDDEQGSGPETEQQGRKLLRGNGRAFTKHIHSFIQYPSFQEYALSKQDVLVIAFLWQEHLEQTGRGVNWTEICGSVQLDALRVKDCLDYVLSLLERQIISFDEQISGNYYLNPLILQTAEFTLNTCFTLQVMGRDLRGELAQELSEKWDTDEDFLSDLKLIFDLCHSSFGEYRGRSRGRGLQLEAGIATICLEIIKTRIRKSGDKLGIGRLVKQQELCDTELSILLLIIYHQTGREECISEQSLVSALSVDPRDFWRLQRMIDSKSRLVTEGVIQRRPTRFVSNAIEMSAAEHILKSIGVDSKAATSMPEPLNPVFEICLTQQTLKDLIISAPEKSLLATIIRKCEGKYQSTLKDWGFEDISRGKQGLVILLYGAPGTGKTFAAGAIANELHKDLIKLNIAKLRNKFYGESEKLVKRAFTRMRKMAEDKGQAPVFLINEADQLIHGRSRSQSSCDAIENTIQSIILEELESFPGILILTTNLESNMDEAFFRRFDLKLRFELPDLECRRELWKLYLREEIPGAKEIDLEVLADRYGFSGAQIALVVQNACVEALSRKGSAMRLFLTDLLKFAELEKPWSKGINKSVGF